MQARTLKHARRDQQKKGGKEVTSIIWLSTGRVATVQRDSNAANGQMEVEYIQRSLVSNQLSRWQTEAIYCGQACGVRDVAQRQPKSDWPLRPQWAGHQSMSPLAKAVTNSHPLTWHELKWKCSRSYSSVLNRQLYSTLMPCQAHSLVLILINANWWWHFHVQLHLQLVLVLTGSNHRTITGRPLLPGTHRMASVKWAPSDPSACLCVEVPRLVCTALQRPIGRSTRANCRSASLAMAEGYEIWICHSAVVSISDGRDVAILTCHLELRRAVQVQYIWHSISLGQHISQRVSQRFMQKFRLNLSI